jgi:hypothetical protein
VKTNGSQPTTPGEGFKFVQYFRSNSAALKLWEKIHPAQLFFRGDVDPAESDYPTVFFGDENSCQAKPTAPLVFTEDEGVRTTVAYTLSIDGLSKSVARRIVTIAG